ncbi:MAG: glutamate--tRNA ligase [Pirellulales bacterium]
MSVRTRFAPSPTGYLHIGGVRTALFNWLFARHHGGAFVLRIDDTDAQRHVERSLAPILHGLRWLGIDWDEGPEVGGDHGPYFQSQRGERYQAAVDTLLESGAAYRDFASSEELAAEREAAKAEGRSFLYSRRWMAKDEADAARFQAEGRHGVVRLKMPREGRLTLPDLVRGDVMFDWPREQDHVIQRADGSVLYHLATVVDDHDFEISHVIRAEEHLSNTPRQVFIAQQLGYQVPQFAHLPVVAEPGSKTKLSKRKLDKYLKHRDFSRMAQHGKRIAHRLALATDVATFNPVLVDFYEAVGYLPDALCNYLLLLGWSLDDKTEEFTRQEMINQFTLDRVNKSPASFDPARLESFQQRAMQQLPIDEKLQRVLPYLQRSSLVTSPAPDDDLATVRAILQAAGDRIKVAGDILEYDTFFLSDEQLEFDEKAFDKRLRRVAEAGDLLRRFRQRLVETEPFAAATIEEAFGQFVADAQIKPGQIIHALRVVTTGNPVGFGMFETLAILGRARVVNRIDRALTRLREPPTETAEP